MRPAIFAVGAAAATWSAPAAAAHAPALAAALRIARRVDGAAGRGADLRRRAASGAARRRSSRGLERAGARATFFLVGEQVRRDPALAREIVAAGHAVALHGDRHRCQLRLTPRTLDDDLARVAATVADATGVAPTLYRPPYGIFSAAGLRARPPSRLARPAVVALGPRLGARARRPLRSPGARRRDLSAGDVILLHDADTYSAAGSWRRTAQALPAVLEAVRRAGLETVPL